MRAAAAFVEQRRLRTNENFLSWGVIKHIFIALAAGLLIGLALSFTGIPEPWSAAIAGALGGITAVIVLKLRPRS